MRLRFWPVALLLAFTLAAVGADTVVAQPTTVLRGGRLFDATDTTLTENPGLVVRAGKIVDRGPMDLDTTGARVVQLDDEHVILPGFVDLHAHYAVDFFDAGRVEETDGYPLLYLASGATTTFTAGEMQPDTMRVSAGPSTAATESGPVFSRPGPTSARRGRGGTRPGRPSASAARSTSGRPAEWSTSRRSGCRPIFSGPSSIRRTVTMPR